MGPRHTWARSPRPPLSQLPVLILVDLTRAEKTVWTTTERGGAFLGAFLAPHGEFFIPRLGAQTCAVPRRCGCGRRLWHTSSSDTRSDGCAGQAMRSVEHLRGMSLQAASRAASGASARACEHGQLAPPHTHTPTHTYTTPHTHTHTPHTHTTHMHSRTHLQHHHRWHEKR
jgi:hypothetical protein